MSSTHTNSDSAALKSLKHRHARTGYEPVGQGSESTSSHASSINASHSRHKKKKRNTSPLVTGISLPAKKVKKKRDHSKSTAKVDGEHKTELEVGEAITSPSTSNNSSGNSLRCH